MGHSTIASGSSLFIMWRVSVAFHLFGLSSKLGPINAVWRMTTSQPLRGDGVVWSYVKDVSRYAPLFAKNGTFVLQLDNVIQPGLDGVFSTTVDATFYASSLQDPPVKQADLIIPLSTMKPNEGNHASVPPGFSVNVTLPQNSVQVYAELHASGNANEEFWYLNAANEYLDDLPPGTTSGQGPLREVRLLVDGRVAGVAFPYATIFTGGFVPAAWKPIPAYPAHDLPTYFIDLTPFVPLLADGNPHTFTIDVASAEHDRAILENWYVSGILQVFTSKSASRPTRGRITEYQAQPYAQSRVSGQVDSETGEVNISVEATRKLLIEAEVVEGNGKVNRVRWSQDLSFRNRQTFSDGGSVMKVQQSTSGRVASRHNGAPVVYDTFDYPLEFNFTISGPDFTHRKYAIHNAYLTPFQHERSSGKLEVDHIYDRDLLPFPIVTRYRIFNHQIADGLYTISPTGNFGNGSNSNIFSYADEEGNTYRRRVNASFNNISLDEISGTLATKHPHRFAYSLPSLDEHRIETARLPGHPLPNL
ncbi:hypothetical protein CC2G_005640 [Coprinopsis cinerea AmutBmut pab1-1]|nr:hypothetical protein CC2G_005640 [Coprinopsis cinerea AmutBmut pab1-1]